MSSVLDAARRAFDSIPLYRAVYGSRPECEADVPFLSVSAFHRAAAPVDIIASTAAILGAVPPFRRGARRLPVTILESERETALRLDRFRHALKILDAEPKAGLRFAIVADEATGPFAADMANFLAWDRAECAALFVSDGPARIHAALAALTPDIVLLATAGPALRPQTGARIVTCIHADSPSEGFIGTDRLLVSDELFVLGAARAGELSYAFDRRSLLIEEDPASGRMAVTTTAFDCLALIRLCLDIFPAGAGAHARL
jgi:hypothetical protein